MSAYLSPAAASADSQKADLPRLLYIGDVRVQSTASGSALLYRLLADYPADRLRVMESNLQPAAAQARIPGVRYDDFFLAFTRILLTRFEGAYRRRLLVGAPGLGRRIVRRLARDPWKPEAVLTIGHGATWLAAAEVARRLQIPLHLIVHDDVFLISRVQNVFRQQCDERLGQVWRQAASRLCISPGMAEKYQAQFGIPGEVLYPSRAPGAPEFEQPPERVTRQAKSLNFVFAGSIENFTYIDLVAALSAAVGQRGHKLTLFTNLKPENAARHGLMAAHFEIRPMVPFKELIHLLREQADVLYVPMSFSDTERANTELSFPSKLTDYTAAGLPLLICAPPYSSVGRWAKQYPLSAEIIEDIDALPAAVERLEDPAHRQKLAAGAIAAGDACFSHQHVLDIFHRHLRRGLVGR
jgi:hypothetical protein